MFLLKAAWPVALAILLGGCAAQQAFRDGNDLLARGMYPEGLAKLEEASQVEPGHLEYRIALKNSRLTAVNRLLAQAEKALRAQNFDDADSAFRTVLTIDPHNSIAEAGLADTKQARHDVVLLNDARALVGQNHLAEAEDILHTVLAGDPHNSAAHQLRAEIEQKRAQDKPGQSRLAAAYQKPMSLEFRDASLRSVFDMISKVSGVNFFYDKDIRADLKINVNAHNTTVEDAIHLVLITNQLEQRVLNENSVLVYPNTPQKIKDYQSLLVRSFYLSNVDAKQVANTLKTILKIKDLAVNEKSNVIIIRDTPEAVRMAEKLIAQEDVGESEVMLEVEVLEVQHSRLLDLGVQWPSQLTLSVQPTSGATLTLADLKHLSPSRVGATLDKGVVNAKNQDSDTNILANPRIRVKNKEKAKIVIGDRVPVFTTTSTATGFISDSVTYVDVGLKLEVEPDIHLDEDVSIKVNLEVSSVVNQVKSPSGTLAYQIGNRTASTVLKLKDGETQILGGLINDQDTRGMDSVPGLGDLPVLGHLFGSHHNQKDKTEILLAITPRLVRGLHRPGLNIAEFESGTDTSVGGHSLSLSSKGEVIDPIASPAVPTQAATANTTAAGPASPLASPSPNGASSNVTPPPAAVAPANPAAPATPVSTDGVMRLNWNMPGQVNVGQTFTASLSLQSEPTLAGLPVMVAYDPAVLQVMGVTEGDFLKQGGGATHFSSRADPATGKLFATTTLDTGVVAGAGNILTISFKAIKASSQTSLQVLAFTPDPAPTGPPVTLPLEQRLVVMN